MNFQSDELPGRAATGSVWWRGARVLILPDLGQLPNEHLSGPHHELMGSVRHRVDKVPSNAAEIISALPFGTWPIQCARSGPGSVANRTDQQ